MFRFVTFMQYVIIAIVIIIILASFSSKACAYTFIFNDKVIEQPVHYSNEDQLFSLNKSIKDKMFLDVIKKTYKVKDDEAKDILGIITKYTSDKYFPTKEHVLSVISIESSFNKIAQSSSSTGLMQINAKVWKMQKNKLFNIDANIKKGIFVLREYHGQFNGDLRKTILAYNVGPTALKQGRYNEKYWDKFQMSYKRFL